MLLMLGILWLGYAVHDRLTPQVLSTDVLDSWQAQLDRQSKLLETEQRIAREQLDAMAVRMAEAQARLLRLDALGERLTVMAKLDRGEFDFSKQPAVGGPEEEKTAAEVVFRKPEFMDSMDRLGKLIDDREEQLRILETLMANREMAKAGYLAGRPIHKGWMSSDFGYRTDPFSGQRAWHAGVDFAGKHGSDIIAVAAGVVTWSSDRYGYGQMIEVNHGNGYSSRYGHNSELLVDVGDIVKKGQVMAKMGSSGRSTGPHVHFEVYKNGKAVNPARYIYRASR